MQTTRVTVYACTLYVTFQALGIRVCIARVFAQEVRHRRRRNPPRDYATHFLHCCNLCFTIDPAPKLYINATPEEKLVAAGSQIEDALLLAQGQLRYVSVSPKIFVILMSYIITTWHWIILRCVKLWVKI